MRYKKKPVVIDAWRYGGTRVDFTATYFEKELKAPVEPTANWSVSGHPNQFDLLVVTKEGKMLMHVGDFLIKGVAGEFYPCAADIFIATYTHEDGREVDL